MPPYKEVHILVPRICEWFLMWQRDLTDVSIIDFELEKSVLGFNVASTRNFLKK